jgi:hypothetical protein
MSFSCFNSKSLLRQFLIWRLLWYDEYLSQIIPFYYCCSCTTDSAIGLLLPRWENWACPTTPTFSNSLRLEEYLSTAGLIGKWAFSAGANEKTLQLDCPELKSINVTLKDLKICSREHTKDRSPRIIIVYFLTGNPIPLNGLETLARKGCKYDINEVTGY